MKTALKRRRNRQSPFPAEKLESRVLFAVPSGFAQSTWSSGLTAPTAMAFAPDGRLFVSEQGGSLRVVSAGGQLLSAPFVTVPARNVDEQGLLSVAFDPGYASNRHVYAHWITADRANRVSRFTADASDPNVAAAGSEVVVFEGPANGGNNHNGGALAFGPDGRLYLSLGDRGDSSQPQSLNNPFGKVLRINPDGTVPSDNPFYGETSGVNRAIWALGLRNPFTMAFQPGTGRLFVNDVGWADYEEVNEVAAGRNFGWPTTEGPFNPSAYPQFTNPLVANASDWPTRSIAGGAFYNPASATFPSSYVGDYFVGDYVGGLIQHVDLSGPTPAVSIFATEGSVARHVDLDLGPDGALYALGRGSESAGTGFVARIAYTGSGAPVIGTQPQSRTVTVGQSATFGVTASGTQPLSYRWQRRSAGASQFSDVPGATSADYTLASPQASDSGAQFRCVVSNNAGTATSDAATLTVTSNRAPAGAITITAPAGGGRYVAGQAITFSGTATDPEQGALPASAYTWSVVFHHDTHTHPAAAPFSGAAGGSYAVPTAGETDSNVWYRVHLTVTDAGGLAHSSFADVLPQTAAVTLAASVPGMTLELDGSPRAAPVTFTGVTGITRSVGAPATQTVNGVVYEFVGWSDGGAATHAISTPATQTTYTAVYRIAMTVAARHVFYNNTAFDGRRAAADAGDDAAIATDKAALLPGQAATFANYTSLPGGITGVMIDLAKAAQTITAENFTFRVGNTPDAGSWAAAPVPNVSRRNGAGVGGSDRITLTWPNRAIRNKWLEVTVRPAPGAAPIDVFYFGNAVADIGDNPANANVNAIDIVGIRARMGRAMHAVTSRWDLNRDKRVNSLDVFVVRSNRTSGAGALALISPPQGLGAGALAPTDTAAAGAWASATFAVAPLRAGDTVTAFLAGGDRDELR